MTIQISNATVFAAAVKPPSIEARACYRLDSNGDVLTFVNGVQTDSGDWIGPKTGMSGYECRATLVSGPAPTGTLGSWLNLGTSREWILVDTSTAGFFITSVLTVEIRDVATQTVQATATITLRAYLTS